MAFPIPSPRELGTAENSESIDPDDFRTAFRRHPSGVVVITTDAGSGPVGFTATSLTSVSLTPPLISFGIASRASSWPHVRDSKAVVVNFLGASQESVARRFATSGIDRFAAPIRWHRLAGGQPALDDVSGRLLSSIEAILPVGDHHVVIAKVVGAQFLSDEEPLVYRDGCYHRVAPARTE
ncbi:flavin reductase family protein [Actinoalloteichus hymeniacidonis]|uniref:Conserved protein of DIM6/NTAB family n=1 Tax=Actinoalloteichus hymeniacidonis TaxID=340345 RepID=A0AAC9HPS3_9PSEU|nr:flavin reductase family protein [Actinoalloteichus hymeniacidonis]AOS63372.1 conserved protein of DIM6/NTAB family [Actinoalloteichus hymeniacidonis]MBB5908588.1 flavin reductase (DIM6/NTAB) family NADH-FMN oxidoreductase RutF [Actinoalloteichus hymeniacidonis]